MLWGRRVGWTPRPALAPADWQESFNASHGLLQRSAWLSRAERVREARATRRGLAGRLLAQPLPACDDQHLYFRCAFTVCRMLPTTPGAPPGGSLRAGRARTPTRAWLAWV